jgi:ankyrin repeat protein
MTTTFQLILEPAVSKLDMPPAQHSQSIYPQQEQSSMQHEAELDAYGRSEIARAALLGKHVEVRRLLKGGHIDPELTDIHGRTPLSLAAEGGYFEVVKLLAKRGNGINTPDNHGRTALSYAVKAHSNEQGHIKATQLLLKRKEIDPDLKDEKGRTPLSYAVSSEYAGGVTKQLLEYKSLKQRGTVDPNSQDYSGRTPLSYAAGGNHWDAVGLLLEWDDIDAELEDNLGRTPFSYAAEGGHWTVVRQLLEFGINTDSKDHDGRSPLSYAVSTPYRSGAPHDSHDPVAKLLMDRTDVDVDLKDNNGRTPVFYAELAQRKKMVDLLNEAVQFSRRVTAIKTHDGDYSCTEIVHTTQCTSCTALEMHTATCAEVNRESIQISSVDLGNKNKKGLVRLYFVDNMISGVIVIVAQDGIMEYWKDFKPSPGNKTFRAQIIEALVRMKSNATFYLPPKELKGVAMCKHFCEIRLKLESDLATMARAKEDFLSSRWN